jgi:hypothetical protein
MGWRRAAILTVEIAGHPQGNEGSPASGRQPAASLGRRRAANLGATKVRQPPGRDRRPSLGIAGLPQGGDGAAGLVPQTSCCYDGGVSQPHISPDFDRPFGAAFFMGGIDTSQSVRREKDEGFSKGKPHDNPQNPYDLHGGHARDCEPACEPDGGLHGRLRPNDRRLLFGE